MMRDQSFSSSRDGTPVYLNVYSFCHCCNVACGHVGLGLYHSAIQIFDIQFMFHGWAGNSTGVSEVLPRTCPYRFEQQIYLGNINYSFGQLDSRILEPLKKQYISNKYDLLNNNCNHFALQMAERLGLGQNHPRSYIFRITNFFNYFRCCIPNCILSGRLDWFTSKQKKEQQLKSIRNSSIPLVTRGQIIENISQKSSSRASNKCQGESKTQNILSSHTQPMITQRLINSIDRTQ